MLGSRPRPPQPAFRFPVSPFVTSAAEQISPAEAGLIMPNAAARDRVVPSIATSRRRARPAIASAGLISSSFLKREMLSSSRPLKARSPRGSAWGSWSRARETELRSRGVELGADHPGRQQVRGRGSGSLRRCAPMPAAPCPLRSGVRHPRTSRALRVGREPAASSGSASAPAGKTRQPSTWRPTSLRAVRQAVRCRGSGVDALAAVRVECARDEMPDAGIGGGSTPSSLIAARGCLRDLLARCGDFLTAGSAACSSAPLGRRRVPSLRPPSTAGPFLPVSPSPRIPSSAPRGRWSTALRGSPSRPPQPH